MEETFYSDKLDNITVRKQTYKMVALRGMVLFPGQTLQFDVARDKSMLAVNKALEENQDVFLVAQRNSATPLPGPKDIYRVGTIAKIKQVLKLPNDSMRLLVGGVKRMEIEDYMHVSPYFEVGLLPFETEDDDNLTLEAVKRTAADALENFKKLDHKMPVELMAGLSVDDGEKLVYTVAAYACHGDAEKQKLLEMRSLTEQLKAICEILLSESEIMALQKKIASDVRASIDKGQKEYYLREQIKSIKKELGEDENEIEEFKAKIKERELPPAVKEKIDKELARMEKMSPTSPEAGVSRTYLEWLTELPWTEQTEDNADLRRAREILDEDHYGLEKVKDRIIEFLAVHRLTDSFKSPILCFVGPPGVGKTSIVESIARAAGKKFVSMSLGGVRDEAEIRGHRRTYIGALPGRIISAVKQVGVVNPVFLLDEIDKMSSDFRGDPASAMLEVLDPNQNFQFKDHYIELPYDLSRVMFVTTANSTDTIAPPLLDRMEVIELSGYTYREKTEIAKKYLLPKQTVLNGLPAGSVTMSDAVITAVIEGYTRESGVRSLEREIASIVRKIAVEVVGGTREKTFDIDKERLTEYLGPPKFIDDEKNSEDEVGLATGLAWTSAGGVTLNIEVALMPSGKGDIILTGSLGDVMKESCRTALSVVRAQAGKYNIDIDSFSKNDVHIHFPEGATPKDGPSAGITVATALLSAFSGRKVRSSVAMTGEITLRGKVLAIGGLKEKSLAAYRTGIKTLLIPKENEKDLKEIPDEVRQRLDIIPVSGVEQVFAAALL